MKRIIFLSLWLCLAAGAYAQQVLLDLMPRLFSDYPVGYSSREYRCIPAGKDSIEISRYDSWTIQKSEVKPEDISHLIAAFDAEAPYATESTRYLGHFSGGDTLSYTLVYQGHLAKESEMAVNHIGYRRFSAAKGFASLDLMGRQMDMRVMVSESVSGKAEPFDTLAIDEIFQQIAARKGATSAVVRYTGSKGGFTFQRGRGAGWTRGRRITLPHATQQDFSTVIDRMASYFTKRQALDIILRKRYGAFFIEDIRQIYLIQLDDDGCLYFLKARTDGDICVPIRWTHVDTFDGR